MSLSSNYRKCRAWTCTVPMSQHVVNDCTCCIRKVAMHIPNQVQKHGPKLSLLYVFRMAYPLHVWQLLKIIRKSEPILPPRSLPPTSVIRPHYALAPWHARTPCLPCNEQTQVWSPHSQFRQSPLLFQLKNRAYPHPTGQSNHKVMSRFILKQAGISVNYQSHTRLRDHRGKNRSCPYGA